MPLTSGLKSNRLLSRLHLISLKLVIPKTEESYSILQNLVSSISKIVSSISKVFSFISNIVSFTSKVVSFISKIVSSISKLVSFTSKVVSSTSKVVSFTSKVVSFISNIVSSLAEAYFESLSGASTHQNPLTELAEGARTYARWSAHLSEALS
ncbi:hypothetical protein C8C84_2567 [Flavobacterium sp. 102]|nr:hypothetical protein C8C84_2567 [Flavobacterium sp. 102]